MVRLSSVFCAAAALAAAPSVLAVPEAQPSFQLVKRAPQQAANGHTGTHHAGAAAQSTPAAGASGAGTGSAAAAGGAAGAGAAAANGQPGLVSFTGTLPASVLSIVATIGSGLPQATASFPLPVVPTAGATNKFISNAPPLPDYRTISPANFPALDMAPPVNSPEVQGWLKQIDFSKVPSIQVNPTSDCSATSNPNVAKANAAGNCWWTCGGCTRDTDITTCPDKNTWGVSYDDGPSPYTPLLLDYFQNNSIKSTFFIVGSRAISRPDMLQAEHILGHQLAVHTWSHTALTTQTNEQIVAELGWTRKVIKDLTGVSPLFMRPPYGDIDDRVRAISNQMNLTPIIWTSANGIEYDTNDWKIAGGTVSAANSAYAFEQIINQAPKINTGYIVLSHDLYEQSVDLSVKVILPYVAQFSPKQNLKPIINCQGQDLRNAYSETTDKTPPTAQQGGANVGGTTSGSSSGNSAGSNSSGGSSGAGLTASASGSAALLVSLAAGAAALVYNL